MEHLTNHITETYLLIGATIGIISAICVALDKRANKQRRGKRAKR